jgi:hypothetical protein
MLASKARFWLNTSGLNQTDASRMVPIVAPAKAGVQVPRARRLLPPDQARGRIWVPAFAGMTGQGRGYQMSISHH